jgi:DNA-binding PadR family transcriptional regulator
LAGHLFSKLKANARTCRPGLPYIAMGRAYLGEFEELVLLTVPVLEGQAYGVTIAGELRRRTSRPISLSSVHIALYRLEEKGFVRSELGGATHARGGRRKRLFTITAAGQSTLAEIRQVRNDLWNAMPKPFPG